MSLKRQAIRVSDIRYRFKTPPFEFMFQWVLGMQTNGGSEIGESFYAASLVKENDPQSWVAAWTTMARQVEQRAATALAAGHAVSAREAHLRAYVYNRTALGFISPFDAAAAKPAWQHAVDCFRRSAALMDPVVEPVSVPCDGAENQIPAVVDYALSRPEVDGPKLAAFAQVVHADLAARLFALG